MTLEIFLTLGIFAAAVLLFVTEKLPVDLIALCIMAALLSTGIVSGQEGIAGFGNTATVTVAAMFVLSAGLSKTGAANVAGATLTRLATRSQPLALLAVMLFIGGLSAFINNTAAVAISLPIVLGVARDTRTSPSKWLMPLSFASMFGGVCTLIGTSTNILVSSIAEQHGERAFSMFEFLPLGLVMVGTGTVYMMWIGKRLIPERRNVGDLMQTFGMGEYLAEVVLLPEAKSVGRTLIDSPLIRDLDIAIVEVRRKAQPLWLPSADTVLEAGDELLVRCSVEKIQALSQRHGVKPKPTTKWMDADLESKDSTLVEAVIAPSSSLAGKSLKETRFRNVFGAVVLAIRHHGQTLHEKLATTALQAGDALLIEVNRGHLEKLHRSPEFVIVSEVGLPETRKHKIVPAVTILVGVVTAATLGLFPIVVSAVIGCVLMILAGCISLTEAYEAIQWRVIFLLAGVLTLGTGMENTGAAHLLSRGILDGLGVLGPAALVSVFYLLTSLLTQTMSNNATAVLIAPIAIATARSLHVDPRPFLAAVTFAASAAFMTPVAYQTNTLVYGPGQYRFGDFFRVGAPLSLLFWVLASWLIPRIWPL